MSSAKLGSGSRRTTMTHCLSSDFEAAPRSHSGPVSSHRLRDGVVLVTLEDGSARLIDLDGDSLAINQSAALMVQAILCRSYDETCEYLARKFGVGAERIRDDMQNLVSDLDRRGMLVRLDCEDVCKRSQGGVPYGIIVPLLAVACIAPRRLTQAKAFLLQAVAFVSVRMWGWRRTLQTWTQTLERIERRRDKRQQLVPLNTIGRDIASAIGGHILPVNCKERALAGLFLSRVAGFGSRLVVGVKTMPFELHCWCECDGRVFADQHENFCKSFRPILVYS